MPPTFPSAKHTIARARADPPALARVPSRSRRTLTSLAAFGGVGAIAFVVDVGVYNLVRSTILTGSPIWSKVVSVTVATVVAWIGNRTLTFRASRGEHVGREAALFALMNVGGLLIAAGCLFVSHYVLGLTSGFADNVSGNVVGLALGTSFRYVGYRFVVFRPAPSAPTAQEGRVTAESRRSGETTHPGPEPLRTTARTPASPRRGDRHHGTPDPVHRTHLGGTR